MKVEVISNEIIYKGFFTLEKAIIKFEKYNQTMSEPVMRLNVYRSDAVSVVLYNSVKRTFIFVRQFRYPVYTVEPENAWMLEGVAGAIEKGLTAEETAVKETFEESGYAITADDLQYIGKCFTSPGGTAERIYLYAVDVKNCVQTGKGGGVEHEVEDIQIEEIPFEQVFAAFEKEELTDAKTLISLLWFKNKLDKSEI